MRPTVGVCHGFLPLALLARASNYPFLREQGFCSILLLLGATVPHKRVTLHLLRILFDTAVQRWNTSKDWSRRSRFIFVFLGIWLSKSFSISTHIDIVSGLISWVSFSCWTCWPWWPWSPCFIAWQILPTRIVDMVVQCSSTVMPGQTKWVLRMSLDVNNSRERERQACWMPFLIVFWLFLSKFSQQQLTLWMFFWTSRKSSLSSVSSSMSFWLWKSEAFQWGCPSTEFCVCTQWSRSYCVLQWSQ